MLVSTSAFIILLINVSATSDCSLENQLYNGTVCKSDCPNTGCSNCPAETSLSSNSLDCVGTRTESKGSNSSTIRTIFNTDASDNPNGEDIQWEYWREAVVWRHVNKPGNWLKSLDLVQIWASNGGVSTECSSAIAQIKGIKGKKSENFGTQCLNAEPDLIKFFEDGKSLFEDTPQDLSAFDEVQLMVSTLPYRGWRAVCHGYNIEMTYSIRGCEDSCRTLGKYFLLQK